MAHHHHFVSQKNHQVCNRPEHKNVEVIKKSSFQIQPNKNILRPRKMRAASQKKGLIIIIIRNTGVENVVCDFLSQHICSKILILGENTKYVIN